MLVRAKETVFHQGSRLRAGAVIEWEGGQLPSYFEPADAPVKPEPDEYAGRKMSKRKTIHDEVIK